MSGLAIHPATAAELAVLIDWAAAEGWNPGLMDREAFHAADPEGFLLGYVNGEPAAGISVIRYGDRFGFLGLFICRADLRGRGYGRALWEAGMAHLGDRTVGLDGVVAQQDRYAAEGFVAAYRNVRYSGAARASERPRANLVELRKGRPAGLLGVVIAYDRPLFPGPRAAFLRAWLEPPGRRTLAYVADNAVRGYGSIRACREGFKIGPLFADSPEIAESLFSALTARHRGAEIGIDVPEPNGAAIALAESHGLVPGFETARMYRGPAPDLPLARIFGVTTLELG